MTGFNSKREAAAGKLQEPAFKWRSVFQEMPTENSHILFCFGVHIVEGSFTTNGWASLAYGTAQPDFWAYMPPPPHHKRNQELYTGPPLPVQRQPLTPDEAISAVSSVLPVSSTGGQTHHLQIQYKYALEITRAIEAAHNIGGGNT